MVKGKPIGGEYQSPSLTVVFRSESDDVVRTSDGDHEEWADDIFGTPGKVNGGLNSPNGL